MRSTRREALGMISAVGATVGLGVEPSAGAMVGPEAVSGTAAGAGTHDGWRTLFNGRDLSGWDFYQHGVGAVDRDQVVHCSNDTMHMLGPEYRGGPAPGMGYVITKEAFGDYHLSVDYKWGTRRYEPRPRWKRDSGILYHMTETTDSLWPDSIEYQIMERNTGDALPINHRAIAGRSLGGVPSWPENPPQATDYAPQRMGGGKLRQNMRAEGDFEDLYGWNTVELIATGQNAAHIVNDRIVTTLYGMQQQNPADKTQYIPLSRGRIILQIECAEIMFRNIKIRQL